MRTILALIFGLAAFTTLCVVPAAKAQNFMILQGTFAVDDCAKIASRTVLKSAGAPCGGTPVVPGGANGNVQFNNAGAFGGLTDTQLTARINAATAALSGALPAWPNDVTQYFRGNGTYAAPTISNTIHGVLVVASSATAVSHTGDLLETILATPAIPALPAGASLEVTALFSFTGTGSKTTRLYYGATGSGTGGTLFMAPAYTVANLSAKWMVNIWNRTTGSQIGGTNSSPTGFGGSSLTSTASAVNTTVATELNITGQLSTVTTDTITLEAYVVKAIIP